MREGALNNFEKIRKLGSGSSGQVYLVRHGQDRSLYAVKCIPISSKKDAIAALSEVQLLSFFHSEFIIGYKKAFYEESSATVCIVMEYASGGDLSAHITHIRRQKLYFSEREIWDATVSIALGLRLLHSKNVMHRDLKSANIFITDRHRYKLGDLNVSKLAPNGLANTQIGTPYYASPEVWGDQPYGFKSDMWSLGCVAYEMAALRPPFFAESVAALYPKLIKGEYPRIPTFYSNDLHNAIKLLLVVDPQSRLSAHEFLDHPVVRRNYRFQDSQQLLRPNQTISPDNQRLITSPSSEHVSVLDPKYTLSNQQPLSATKQTNPNIKQNASFENLKSASRSKSKSKKKINQLKESNSPHKALFIDSYKQQFMQKQKKKQSLKKSFNYNNYDNSNLNNNQISSSNNLDTNNNNYSVKNNNSNDNQKQKSIHLKETLIKATYYSKRKYPEQNEKRDGIKHDQMRQAQIENQQQTIVRNKNYSPVQFRFINASPQKKRSVVWTSQNTLAAQKKITKSPLKYYRQQKANQYICSNKSSLKPKRCFVQTQRSRIENQNKNQRLHTDIGFEGKDQTKPFFSKQVNQNHIYPLKLNKHYVRSQKDLLSKREIQRRIHENVGQKSYRRDYKLSRKEQRSHESNEATPYKQQRLVTDYCLVYK